MPLLKRLVNLRTCRALILPVDWLRWVEAKYGRIDYVEVETNGELKVRPSSYRSPMEGRKRAVLPLEAGRG
ncbi:MAG: hypothetical protein QXO94_06300 [Candidatus Bathyarchaeia archaeon]